MIIESTTGPSAQSGLAAQKASRTSSDVKVRRVSRLNTYILSWWGFDKLSSEMGRDDTLNVFESNSCEHFKLFFARERTDCLPQLLRCSAILFCISRKFEVYQCLSGLQPSIAPALRQLARSKLGIGE